MPLDSEKFPTASYGPPHFPRIPWTQRISAVVLRRKYRAEVNDPTWRKDLKPVQSHPRREKRRPSRPR